MDTAAAPATVASVQRELQEAITAFEQHVREAVAKVDRYFKKGSRTDDVSVETKLGDFKEGAFLFNAGCKTMLLAVKQVAERLAVCEPTAPKTEKLLVEAQRLSDAKDKLVAELQQRQGAAQEGAARAQIELQRQLDDARAEVAAQSNACALLKAERVACWEELQGAQSQLTLVGNRLKALEQNRAREFALLERMSCDHERDIAVWQRRCSQALQEVEFLRAEKEGLQARLVDEKLRFQLRELQQECNRLRTENATLRQTTRLAGTPREQERNASTAVNPVVVSLEAEKRQLADQLSVAFAERLALEQELLLLRHRLAAAEGDGQRAGGGGERSSASPASEDAATDEDARVTPELTSGACSVGKATTESGLGSACDSGVAAESHLGVEKEEPQTGFTPTPEAAEEELHGRRDEAYVRQLELWMREVAAAALRTVDEERSAAEQRLQQELSLREDLYQSQLTKVREAGERRACEATEALLHCQELQRELELLRTAATKEKATRQELVSDAERRLAVAQREIFGLKIDNEQLRVKERALRRELEGAHAVRSPPPTTAPLAQRQEPKCSHGGSSGPGSSSGASGSGGGYALVPTPRSSSATGRLDEVIRQLQERLTALNAEVARVTETYEVEHDACTRRLQQLRAALLYWSRDDAAASDGGGEGAAEMRQRSEVEVAAVVEAQRVAQGNVLAYYAQAGKKRGELLKALERATNMRLALKGQ
ncbi:uncharacterized protein Tco025E_03726 [Trypanosoma conorhini]|uniref:Uncharacterized protein n=1 Tax=Trypanosoma conorhini TaxID=83891 RepID=A0A422PSV0_9TRYP|nr:uncharacterized protein Tco025E_03726 [Trypanosoma conorhini]RNF20835.1 hypothetical protein Tco025E_03726 [Trypanosoma conorhini]